MTGTTLKLMMMILMVFDHIGPFISARTASILHLLTRPVAPVFAFMAVEGFIHTRNRERYLMRLYSSALFMGIGNKIINSFIIKNSLYSVHNNIFLTLALGLTILYIYENLIRKNRSVLGGLLIFLVFMIGGVVSEGGIIVLPFMLIIYIFRDQKTKRNIILLGLTLLLGLSSFVKYPSWGETFEMLAMNSDFLIFIAGLPFIYLYNGKKGSDSKFMKYLFYVFYPAHLWIIGILASKIL